MISIEQEYIIVKQVQVKKVKDIARLKQLNHVTKSIQKKKSADEGLRKTVHNSRGSPMEYGSRKRNEDSPNLAISITFNTSIRKKSVFLIINVEWTFNVVFN